MSPLPKHATEISKLRTMVKTRRYDEILSAAQQAGESRNAHLTEVAIQAETLAGKAQFVENAFNQAAVGASEGGIMDAAKGALDATRSFLNNTDPAKLELIGKGLMGVAAGGAALMAAAIPLRMFAFSYGSLMKIAALSRGGKLAATIATDMAAAGAAGGLAGDGAEKRRSRRRGAIGLHHLI